MVLVIFKIFLTSFFCYDYHYVYSYISNSLKDLSLKQKAYIVSIRSTYLMFLCGVYFNYIFYVSNYDKNVYINSLSWISDTIAQISILNFTAYLIMDCYLGYTYYPEFMTSLSGYVHHSIYLVINMYALYTGLYPLYLLYMVSELPSFLLNVGSFNKEWRNDILFGLSFFITRILYHIYLLYVININIISVFGIPILGIHIYWFKNWVRYILYKKKL